MLHDPVAMYEEARRNHQRRISEGTRLQALRDTRGPSGVRVLVAGVLHRVADAIGGHESGQRWPKTALEGPCPD